MTEIKVTIEYNANGLPVLTPTTDCYLTVEKHDGEFTIKGNRNGLMLLARGLIGLANMDTTGRGERNQGYHIHLDDLYEINDENVSIIIASDDGDDAQ